MKNKIIQGDCIEVMKEMSNKSIDLMITDPPYNAKDIGPNQRKYSLGEMCLPLPEYKKFCRNWFKEARRVSKRLLFTPGIANITYYPQPTWVLCWHKPAAVSYNRMGGYNAWEPVFFYGKMPKGKRVGQDYIKVNTFNSKKGPEADHPCPKPTELWGQLVEKFSKKGELVGDCFLGSGTTAVVTKKLNMNYLGIELNGDYIKIANERLRQNNLL